MGLRAWRWRRQRHRLLTDLDGRALLTVQALREEAFQALFERLMTFDEDQGVFRPVSSALTPHAVKKLHRRIVLKVPSRRSRRRKARAADGPGSSA